MKKLLVAALIVPVALLGAARPAKAGSKAGAILTGVAVGIGAALSSTPSCRHPWWRRPPSSRRRPSSMRRAGRVRPRR